MAQNVEASTRPSSHCNIMDAITSVEACTSTAAHQASYSQESTPAANSNGMSLNASLGWEGLAAFLYGPDWIKLVQERLPNISPSAEPVDNPTSKGGKSLSRMIQTNKPEEVKQTNDNSAERLGWNAPHYDDIQNFPVRLRNGGPLGSRNGLVFHGLVSERQACREPDKKAANGDIVKKGTNGVSLGQESNSLNNGARNLSKLAEDAVEKEIHDIPSNMFLDGVSSFWGTSSISHNGLKDKIQGEEQTGASISNKDTDLSDSKATDVDANSKKRRRDGDENMEDESNSKRLRKDEKSEDKKSLKQGVSFQNRASINRHPLHIPPFLPPFPPEHTYDSNSSKVLGGVNTNQLPDLSKSEQTLGPSARILPTRNDNTNRTQTVRSSLVTMGRTVGNTFWGSDWKNESDEQNMNITVSTSSNVVNRAGSTTTQDPVKTLSRASSARASRILEGSMDVFS